MAEQKREKASFTIAQHPDFPATTDGGIMTSYELSKYVNALFSRMFADYAGCRIFVDQAQNPTAPQLQLSQSHPVQLELYFTLGKPATSERAMYAFKELADKIKDQYRNSQGKMNYIAMTMGYNVATTTNKCSEITQDAIDLLHGMLFYEIATGMPGDPTAKNFNDKGIIVEASQNNNMGTPYGMVNQQRTVYNIVRYIDINSVLATLFGADEKGDHMLYNVVPIKPIIPAMTGYQVPNLGEQKWLFNVVRINKQKFFDVCNELGNFNVGNGMNFCSDTF